MREKTTKLLSSILVLVLCLSMFLGTTLAWFTDTAGSGNNQITAGNLDVELEYLADDSWVAVEETTNLFKTDALWEPGHTEVVYLRVANAGTLALKYQLGIRVAGETASVNMAGERLALSDHIQYAVIEDVQTPYTDRDEALAAAANSHALSTGYTAQGVLLAGMEPQYLAMVVFMPETVGNEANYATGAPAPSIQLGIQLHATQQSSEADGFSDDYDTGALLPEEKLDTVLTEPVLDKAENGVIVEELVVGNPESEVFAEIPQGVALADGAEVLSLSVQAKEESEADISVKSNETVTALDIHVEGVAEDNTVPMLVTLKNLLPTGLNTTSVEMYHVEDGQTVAMTLTANPVNHNEFSYDAATGTVVLCVASFSEYVAVTDNWNTWEGAFDFTWYNGKTSPYTISSADQLAAFGAIVDGGYKKKDGTTVTLTADNFAGKTVKLGADIDLGGTVSFNPIGYGYAYAGYTPDGKTFNGTFDGQNHTISGLYQNGWDLGLSYCMAGGGLFASVLDATIQNLTINGAEIVMECVDMGILVGLSQGTCTYENITITNSSIANYQRSTGGVVGEVSPEFDANKNVVDSKHTFNNVTVASSVVVGSLWGDFDASCGGVIGGRWDDANGTKVVMTDCIVAPRMDVYNDVTSSYQWYAYRRAGMLIGNTDLAATTDGRTVATADFLECDNVNVYYGNWAKYHYCEFNNHNSSWPFVRAEAGENCDAFSNPRYGVPNDINGKPVTAAHTQADHQEGDDHMVELPFNQLYGGGQGVYGETEHPGVTTTEIKYTVTYVYDGNILHIETITDNSKPFLTHNPDVETAAVAAVEAAVGGDHKFVRWVNAGSTEITEIPADHTKDVVLYPAFATIHTARFVDQQGNIIYEEAFSTSDKKLSVTPAVPAVDGGFSGQWEVHVNINGTLTKTLLSDYKFNDATDITIYPVYNTNDGIISLTPVDSDGDGITNYYAVTNVKENDANINIVIPSEVNGIPVTQITDGAFKEFDNITTVRIPTNITYLGEDAFANKESNIIGILKYEQITFLYEGTYAQWQAIEKDDNWDRYVGQGSKIYFLADSTYSEETAGNGLWSASDRVWSAPKAGTYNPNP